MTLEVYIAELLRKHNCVVLPDFGGFVANVESAKIDAYKGKITPPFKSILFNSHLRNNDGLLADYVGKTQGYSYANAVSFVEKEIEKWIIALNEGNRIEIGELGFLFQNGRSIVFEQNREINLCLEAYGLKPVNLPKQEISSSQKTLEIKQKIADVVETKTLKRKEEETINEVNTEEEIPVIQLSSQPETIKEEFNEKVVSINSSPKSKRTWIRYAAVAAILPLAFYTYWIPMETDFMKTGKIQFADFNPFQGGHASQYEMRISEFESAVIPEVESWDSLTKDINGKVKIYNYHFSDDLYIPIELSNPINESTTLDSDKNTSGEFQIIAGCFGVKENAENLVNELKKKSFSAAILDKNKGLHRVTAGGFDSKESAEKALENFRSEGYSGWILKM